MSLKDKKGPDVGAIQRLIIPADEFAQLSIPPRAWLAEGAILHPSLSMLYAYRGSGKSVTAMKLALCAAAGVPWLGYNIPRRFNGLYIDGEMPRADLIQRIKALCAGAGMAVPSNLYLLTAEDMALSHFSLNLAHEVDRDALAQAIAAWERRNDVNLDFLVIDNWFSLVRGVDDVEDADVLNVWLMLLRHANLSVIMVHQTGASGDRQRGGTAREDPLDVSIRLKRDSKTGQVEFAYDKVRGSRPNPDAFYLDYQEEEGRIILDRAQEIRKGAKWTGDILDTIQSQGPKSFTELEAQLGAPKVSLNRALSKLIKENKIHKTREGLFEVD